MLQISDILISMKFSWKMYMYIYLVLTKCLDSTTVKYILIYWMVKATELQIQIHRQLFWNIIVLF